MSSLDPQIEQFLNGLNISKEEFTSQEKLVLRKILSEIDRTGKSNLLESLYMEDYDEKPVSMKQFIEDEFYIGNATRNGKQIWDAWKDILCNEIFDSRKKLTQLIFSGAIGTGKSSIACIVISYLIYKLLCLKDPSSYYNVLPGSKPGIALFNITLDKGTGVAFAKIMSTCLSSPWFLNHGQVAGSKVNQVYIPDKNITIGVGSMAEHFIGLDTYCAFMDEVAYKENKELAMVKMKAYDALLAIVRRMESRFMDNGLIPGMTIIASSARTEDDFLTQYMAKYKSDPHTLIVNRPIYEVAPKDRYSGKTFSVAVGTKTDESFIISTEEEEDFKDRAYSVYKVPMEHYSAFDGDITGGIRDILGIPSKTAGLYFDEDKVNNAINPNLKNIFRSCTIPLGFNDNTKLTDYVDISRIDTRLIRYPIFVHHDLSLRGDGTGIFGHAVCHDTYLDDQKEDETITWRFLPVFYAQIRPLRKGDQIPLHKIREGVIELKDKFNLNIQAVSADGYQSAEMLQQYKLAGIPSYLISMDRAPSIPYSFARTNVNTGRVFLPDEPLLKEEMLHLVENRLEQKIDHLPGFSKDVCDAWGGSQYCALEHNKKNPIFMSGGYLFNDVMYLINERSKGTSGNDSLSNMPRDFYSTNDILKQIGSKLFDTLQTDVSQTDEDTGFSFL